MNPNKKLAALALSVVLSLPAVSIANAEPAPCEKPGDFTLTAAPGNQSMSLAWTTSAGADAYDVYYSPRAPFAATNVLGNQFTVTNLRNGYIGYSFGIIAKNACGTTWSNTINQVATSATGAPAKPSISVNDNNLYTKGEFTVNWNIWSGNKATSGRILENGSEVALNYFEEIGTSSGQSFSWFFKRPSGTYTYQVELINPFGTTLSDPVTVVVP
ncbi:chitinase N-terminal domain-containing protein [Paenibacillus methanolicus]|uniref:Chitinase A-like protein n=1 Tax=Paenibacillus methanolicus TaxID=582686 RepID=A0A5S5CGZ8_9BACL|nr:chitinase N-terminal domain-containing protein [Paenibacillus methanolicus]TYP79056.1 chitinase A-like protein [Paenibacillus methanolicus]